MSQYKYYFKKPKGEIVKDILYWLMVTGMVAVASTSPTFLYDVLRTTTHKRYKKQSVRNAFSRLQKEGAIVLERHNHQVYLSLTKAGEKKAGRFQINSLQITRPKQWDGRWRAVIFDIEDRERIKRDALRGFLKHLPFYKLQKSVWVCPFDCRDEIALLRDFFGIRREDLQVMVVEKIEGEHFLRKIFHLGY